MIPDPAGFAAAGILIKRQKKPPDSMLSLAANGLVERKAAYLAGIRSDSTKHQTLRLARASQTKAQQIRIHDSVMVTEEVEMSTFWRKWKFR
ncbi:MAG: hypothetical protein KDE34_19690 [Anaerolineales bacterium]|nr:hypothetical protein [Anaerolineales bacterium]